MHLKTKLIHNCLPANTLCIQFFKQEPTCAYMKEVCVCEICMCTYPSHMLARQTGALWARLQMNMFPFCKYSSGASEHRSGCQEAFRFLVHTSLGLVPAAIKSTLKWTGSSPRKFRLGSQNFMKELK